IFLPLFSGFGPQAISSRLNDAEAKALFTADGLSRRGKQVLLKTIAEEAANNTPTLRHVIVLKRLGVQAPWEAKRDHWWHELRAAARDNDATESAGAEDTLMLIYTSGTTGKPKGAVHTHCGFPIKAAQDMKQGLDLHAD